MRPIFVLTPPRARTCWLTVYLRGLGVPAVHEGWKYWTTPKALRLAMEAMGSGVVVNVDSSNVTRVAEIEDEFPEARFVCILRAWPVCMQSLRDAIEIELPEGEALGERTTIAQSRAIKRGAFVIVFDHWTPEISRSLIEWLDPDIAIDPLWHYFCSGLDIQLLSTRLNTELDMLRDHHVVTIGD